MFREKFLSRFAGFQTKMCIYDCTNEGCQRISSQEKVTNKVVYKSSAGCARGGGQTKCYTTDDYNSFLVFDRMIAAFSWQVTHTDLLGAELSSWIRNIETATNCNSQEKVMKEKLVRHIKETKER